MTDQFHDLRFKWTATAAIGIHLTKPNCHRRWISKMKSGCEDTLEEWYAIRLCFKLRKRAIETYGMLHPTFRPSCMNRTSVLEWFNNFFFQIHWIISSSKIIQFTDCFYKPFIWSQMLEYSTISFPRSHIIKNIKPG